MKKIIILAIIAVFAASCNGAAQVVDSSNIILTESVDTIAFDYANIDTIFYVEEDNIYIMHYDDSDVFDYDYLSYVTKRDRWYGNYVNIEVGEELLPDFMYNYHNYMQSDDFWRKDSLNNQYSIAQHTIVYYNGDVDVLYYIIPHQSYVYD